jgi:hypothetical protein
MKLDNPKILIDNPKILIGVFFVVIGIMDLMKKDSISGVMFLSLGLSFIFRSLFSYALNKEIFIFKTLKLITNLLTLISIFLAFIQIKLYFF